LILKINVRFLPIVGFRSPFGIVGETENLVCPVCCNREASAEPKTVSKDWAILLPIYQFTGERRKHWRASGVQDFRCPNELGAKDYDGFVWVEMLFFTTAAPYHTDFPASTKEFITQLRFTV